MTNDQERAAKPAQPRDDAVFVVWWSDHMPNSTEADAWAEWCSLRSNQSAAQAQVGEYPELPPLQVRYDGLGHTTTMGYGASQMRDYADAACAARKAALTTPAQAAPAQAGEPWYGHKFKEQHRGIWSCECGKTVKEATADWLDSVLEDAARYRFLRNGEWRDTELEPFIRLQRNALWDSKIDAAIAAQQGEKHE